MPFRSRPQGGVLPLRPRAISFQRHHRDLRLFAKDNEAQRDMEDVDDSGPADPRKPWYRATAAPLQALGKLLSMRTVRLAMFLMLGGILSFLGRGGPGTAARSPQEVLYSDFLQLVSSGNVRSVRFEQGNGRLFFDVKDSIAKGMEDTKSKPIRRQFYTRQIPDPQLISTLREHNVQFGTIKATLSSAVGKILFTALALWVPLIPMFIVMRRFLDGRNGSNRPKKAKNKQRAPRIRFDDVAGVESAKVELEEVVACLRDSSKFTRVGAKLPSGVLLCGPPGTGKTLLAKAVAGEANVPFLSVSASEFVELFVGRGAARIRELFSEARKRSPCVIFIDELDAIGGKRGAGLNEERDQTLNQLLTELDGFEGRPGIVLLAATNRAEVLDPALLRPGRLSRKVNVPLPDVRGRASILSVHLRNVPIEDLEAAAETVARMTSGFSGAELANVVNEAAFLAARKDNEIVTLDELSEAVIRTRFGVNGGQSELPSWSNWLSSLLINNSNKSRKTMRSQPLGSS
jgi:ATP-dependent Zn protease